MSWKIGEMTHRTGLTVRTLHFYEELGLIGPVSRTPSGHRLYQSADLIRIQQIKAYKQLGISLPEIKPLLGGSYSQLQSAVSKQLVQVQRQRQALEQLEARLQELDSALSSKSCNSDRLNDLLFTILESMSMYEKYFEQAEIDAIHTGQHTDENGKQTSMEDGWAQWCGELKSQIKAGAKPTDKSVQALMSHWDEMLEHLTGGDAQRLDAFNQLFHSEPQARADHGIDEQMYEFMGLAKGGH